MKISFPKNNEMIERQKHKDDTRYQIISWGHWFALFNIFLTIILASRYLFIMDWPNTLGGRAYAFISLLGHFSFLVFLVYLLCIFPLSFLIKNPKTLRIVAVSLATIGLTVMLVDQQVYYSVNLHLNTLVWSLLIEPTYNVSTHEWQRFFAFMPILFLVQLLYANWSWLKLRSLQRQRWVKGVSTVFVFSFILTHLAYAWADATFYRPITMQKANLPLSYPMTARGFLAQYGFLDQSAYTSRLSEEGDPSLQDVTYPLTPLALENKATGYPIFLIVFDELNDELMKKVPGLMEFAKQNHQFNRHYSFSSAEFVLEYGVSPVYEKSIIRQNLPSLLSLALKERGYQQFIFNNHKLISGIHDEDKYLHQVGSLRELLELWEKMGLMSSSSQMMSEDTLPLSLFASLSLSAKDILSNPKDWQRLLDFLINFNDNAVILITAKAPSLDNVTHSSSMRVPLLMKWPELTLPVPLNKITNHQDIVATVLPRALRVKNISSDFSQGEDLFYPSRQNPFWVDGTLNEMWIQSSNGTVILNAKGATVIDSRDPNNPISMPIKDPWMLEQEVESHQQNFKKKQLGTVLQALFDLQRFWSN